MRVRLDVDDGLEAVEERGGLLLLAHLQRLVFSVAENVDEAALRKTFASETVPQLPGLVVRRVNRSANASVAGKGETVFATAFAPDFPFRAPEELVGVAHVDAIGEFHRRHLQVLLFPRADEQLREVRLDRHAALGLVDLGLLLDVGRDILVPEAVPVVVLVGRGVQDMLVQTGVVLAKQTLVSGPQMIYAVGRVAG